MTDPLNLDESVEAPPIPEEPAVNEVPTSSGEEQYTDLAVVRPWNVDNFQAHSEDPTLPSVLVTREGTRVLAQQAEEIIASAATVGVTIEEK